MHFYVYIVYRQQKRFRNITVFAETAYFILHYFELPFEIIYLLVLPYHFI